MCGPVVDDDQVVSLPFESRWEESHQVSQNLVQQARSSAEERRE